MQTEKWIVISTNFQAIVKTVLNQLFRIQFNINDRFDVEVLHIQCIMHAKYTVSQQTGKYP